MIALAIDGTGYVAELCRSCLNLVGRIEKACYAPICASLVYELTLPISTFTSSQVSLVLFC
jgi:hypothetical protein